jgi:hypothetical protein
MQGNSSVIATIAVVFLVLLAFASYSFYSTNSALSSVSSQNAGLKGQIGSLDQQVSTLNQQVSILQQKTVQVVTVSNTIVTVETTTSVETSTVTSVSAVPEGTLVIEADSYNSSAKTFTFQVQDTQDYTVYAQLSAVVGIGTFGGCGTPNQEYFISPVYTFQPLQVTAVTFNTALITSPTCGSSLNDGQITLSFMAGNNLVVSPSYTFYYNP